MDPKSPLCTVKTTSSNGGIVFNSPPQTRRLQYNGDDTNTDNMKEDLRKTLQDVGLEVFARDVGLVNEAGELSSHHPTGPSQAQVPLQPPQRPPLPIAKVSTYPQTSTNPAAMPPVPPMAANMQAMQGIAAGGMYPMGMGQYQALQQHRGGLPMAGLAALNQSNSRMIYPSSPSSRKRGASEMVPSPLNQTPPETKTKKRRTSRAGAADKGSKGLRHFSMKVCKRVKDRKNTTYNEVADDLVKEITDARGEEGAKSFDEKNIRRRVYDALNVLMAMDIISKEKKDIRWEGLPGSSSSSSSSISSSAEVEALRRERDIRLEAVRLKQQHLREAIGQRMAFGNLVNRNRTQQQQQQQQQHQKQQQQQQQRLDPDSLQGSPTGASCAAAAAARAQVKLEHGVAMKLEPGVGLGLGGMGKCTGAGATGAAGVGFEARSSSPPPPPPQHRVHLPFILVSCGRDTVVQCDSERDNHEVFFNLDGPFEIRDDNEVLKQLRLPAMPLQQQQQLLPPHLLKHMPCDEDQQMAEAAAAAAAAAAAIVGGDEIGMGGGGFPPPPDVAGLALVAGAATASMGEKA